MFFGRRAVGDALVTRVLGTTSSDVEAHVPAERFIIVTGPSGIGKSSFAADDLRQNFDALVDAIVKSKPAGAKGKYLQKISLSSTMGPGLKIDTSEMTGV